MFLNGEDLAREAGRRGGHARAASLSTARARKLARRAANARWKDPAQREAQSRRMKAVVERLRAEGRVGKARP